MGAKTNIFFCGHGATALIYLKEELKKHPNRIIYFSEALEAFVKEERQ